MARRVVVLSGRVASGKTGLGDGLIDRFGAVRIQTRDVIRELLPVEVERGKLQSAGDKLDEQTGFTWVAQSVGREAPKHPFDAILIVDSARRKEQIDHLRSGFGQRVVHVHLTASEAELGRRFRARKGPVKDKRSYKAVLASKTEQQVEQLAECADIVIDTERCSREDVVVRVAARIGLYGMDAERLVDVLVGAQWGSEGKGQVAAYLAPEYDVLVRVGGPNAGHQVFGDPKRTFYHLPSGTQKAEAAQIVLGPGATIRVPKLEEEIKGVGLTPDRLSIDPHAMLIEPRDVKFEKGKLVDTIGSTGQGVGAATARKVLRTKARPEVRLAKDEPRLRDYIRETTEVLDVAYARGSRIFLEGTQGTALSLHHGEYPFVTSRDTTVSGCMADAGIPPRRIRRTIMVCRSYPIRVGGESGPMGLELTWSTVAKRSGIPKKELERAERTSTTNRERRVAEFNWELFHRSVSLNAPTDIALTFADYFTIGNREARRFDQLSLETREFIEEMERVACAPVSLVAVRFHYRSIIDRRTW